MTPSVSLREAMSDPQLFGSIIGGDTWLPWRVTLLAAMGEPLEPDELNLFRRLSGRSAPPREPVSTLAAVVGRRGGKTTAASVLAGYIGGMCKHELSVGERGVVLLVAPSQDQARISLDYIAGAFDAAPMLSKLIERKTAESIELTNRVSIEVRSASFRRVRGFTTLACIADEVAFWHVDGSANPDTEILEAIRPSLMTTQGPLILISSPYAKRGELYETFRRHWGGDGAEHTLVVRGASREFNDSLPQASIDREYERNPVSAAAEYGAEFRSDVEAFLSPEAIRACVEAGCRERLPVRQWRYVAFTDPSGGSSDSMTLAIAHREGNTAILDLVREVQPPFSPEAVVEAFAADLKRYRLTKVYGDKYAGEWPRERFRVAGINYETAPKSKSEIYVDFLPLVTSGAVDLLDDERLVHQLSSLERRAARSGKDSIDHRPGAHDDRANAVAGVLTMAATMSQWRGSPTGVPKNATANVGYSHAKGMSALRRQTRDQLYRSSYR